MEYIRVTKENLEKEHICCAISNNKDIQVSSKKAWLADRFDEGLRFLYKGIIIKHNKTEPTYTKTSLFLCEKRRFFMARTEKGVVAPI